MNFDMDSTTYLQNKVASLEAMGVTQSVTDKGECRATGFARNADLIIVPICDGSALERRKWFQQQACKPKRWDSLNYRFFLSH